ncbi:MAG: alpha/beta hydrolase [Solirubrobacteraceae bacterium]
MPRILRNWKVTHRTPEGPADMGERDGLAYALWMPEGRPGGGVVAIHGAGSCKESHFDFARAARAAGLAAATYDQRGHGESGGALDGRLLDDVATMAALLPAGPLALRGSSMGGYVALLAAARLDAAAVVAICPAGAEHLLRGLRSDEFEFEADRRSLEGFLLEHSLELAIQELRSPMLLLHAEGDEQIPVEHSAGLYRAAGMPRKRLIALPGGHHRSIQHDPEMHAETLRFIARAFGGSQASPAES